MIKELQMSIKREVDDQGSPDVDKEGIRLSALRNSMIKESDDQGSR